MRLIVLAFLSLLPLSAQLTTPSTTLTAPVTINGTGEWCLGSGASVVLPSNTNGTSGSYLLIDREAAQVQRTGSNSNCFVVKRGQLGSSASVSHSVGSTVWIGQPAVSSGDPSRPFNGAFVAFVPSGSCVAADQFTLPVIFTGPVSAGAWFGTVINCTNGQWTEVESGPEVPDLPFYLSSDYNFLIQSGSTVTGDLSVAGTNTVRFAPCPRGVGGADTNHYLRLSGFPGADETVLINGGTCTSGAAAGTIRFNTANIHSTAWTIGSATFGTSEAIWTMSAGVGGSIVWPGGRMTLYAPIKRRPGMTIWLNGQGQNLTILEIAADFPNSAANAVLDWTPGDAQPETEGGGSNFTIDFPQPDSASIAAYTHWKPAILVNGTYHTEWENISLIRCWDGVELSANTNGATFKNVIASNFHYMFNLEGRSFDTVRIDSAQSTTLGLVLTNQINVFLGAATGNVGMYIGSIDDLKVNKSTFGSSRCADFHTGVGAIGPAAMLTDTWCEGLVAVSNGLVKFENLTMAGTGAAPLFSQTGGLVFITNGTFLYVGSNVAIYSGITGNSTSAAGTYPPGLSIANSRIDTQGFDVTGLSGFAGAPYSGDVYYNLSNVFFYRTPGVAYSTSAISVLNGTGTSLLTANGVRISPKGAGTGNGINIGNDVAHVISNNDGGGYSVTLPVTMNNMQWFANNDFSGNIHRLHDPMKITSRLSPSTFAPLQTENYIASETGVNNAIAGALLDAGGTAVPLAAGVRATILLAHTLQAGANTFNLNAGGAVNIKSSRNPANNIATAYAVGGILTLTYDGTQWLDASQ